MLWTQFRHRDAVHQTTALTFDDRYPALFDLAARELPRARRILSFGCSTGEELLALRRRFSKAEIVGAEINGRSRRAAERKVAGDVRITVVAPDAIGGEFDAIFALAVLQREPAMVEETGLADLSGHYPFARFDAAVAELVGRLRPDGLLCIFHSHYRIEDSSATEMLQPVKESPLLEPPLFGRDSLILHGIEGRSMFRKRP